MQSTRTPTDGRHSSQSRPAAHRAGPQCQQLICSFCKGPDLLGWVSPACSQCCCHGAGTAAPSPSSVGLNHATNCQLQTALALMTPKSLSMQNRKVQGYRRKKKAVQRQPRCRMLLVQQMVQGCGSEFKHCRETLETSMGWSPREHDKECCCARVCNRQILGKTRFSNFTGIFFPLLLDFDSSRAVAEVWT